MNEVVVKDLLFSYPREKAPTLNNLSFSADAGKITALIGPNGAGKTTVIKAMVGLLKAKGKVSINGMELSGKHSEILKSDVGYLTQESGFMSQLSVFEVVLMGKIGNLGLKVQDEVLEKVWNTIKILHLEGLAQRPYYALSGGQRKMVNIAQTIVKDPKVLILDEPAANLDMQKTLEVMELVRAYTVSMNTASIVTLHDLNTASHFADKLVLIKDGRVFSQGTPSEVITRENIREAYGVNIELSCMHSSPHIHPLSSVRKTEFNFESITG